MRHLLLALAVLGVILGCSIALAVDGGSDPEPPAIDAGARETPPDAGPYRSPPPPPPPNEKTDAAGDDDDLDSVGGILQRAYLSIRNGDHVARELAALALIFVSLLITTAGETEKFSKYVPSFFKSKRGRFVLTGLLAAMGAIGHQALASSFGDWEVWKAALAVFVEASFAYVATKSLLNRSRSATSAAP